MTTWTDTPPASSRILTSAGGTTWTEAHLDSTGKLNDPVDARHVRVEVTSAGTTHPGMPELEVR